MLGRRLALTAILMLTLVCDDSPRGQTPRFAIDVTWEGSKSCFYPLSPPFTLNGIPAGTRKLRFTMTDLEKMASVTYFAFQDGTRKGRS